MVTSTASADIEISQARAECAELRSAVGGGGPIDGQADGGKR